MAKQAGSNQLIIEEEDEESKNILIEDVEPLERDCLPWLKDPSSRPSIWTILKDTIGKDISRISMPVYFNDPTSLVQRCAVACEYNYLLDLAAKETD